MFRNGLVICFDSRSREHGKIESNWWCVPIWEFRGGCQCLAWAHVCVCATDEYSGENGGPCTALGRRGSGMIWGGADMCADVRNPKIFF
jgi:hypothetical protein